MDDFSKYYLLDWLAMGFSLSGAYLLGSRNKFGFFSISLANALWIFLGFTLMSSLGIGIGNIVFFYYKRPRIYLVELVGFKGRRDK